MKLGTGWIFRTRNDTLAELIGKLVVEIDCRGCMGEDHRFVRLGVIEKIVDQRDRFGRQTQSIMQAKCRVVHSRMTLTDEFFYVSIEDGCFQSDESVSSLMWYRH